MAFTILKHLSETDKPEVNGEISNWLQNLSDFAALFFKKFPSVDMLGIITFLLRDMSSSDGFVLHVILSKMYDWTDFVPN